MSGTTFSIEPLLIFPNSCDLVCLPPLLPPFLFSTNIGTLPVGVKLQKIEVTLAISSRNAFSVGIGCS